MAVYDKKLHEKTLREEGRKEGISIGRAEGRSLGKDALLDILSEKGSVSKELQAKISGEDDLEVLRSWIKLAIHVETAGEFEEKIK